METSVITCSSIGEARFSNNRTFIFPRLLSANSVHLGLPLLNKIERILNCDKPDVIHLQVPSLISLATLWLAKRKKIPVAIGIHDLPANIAVFSPMFRQSVSRVTKWVLTRWFNGADILISPSQYGKKYYQTLGVTTKTHVISNGVDPRIFRFQIEKAKAFMLKYLGRTVCTKPLLLYVGRISQEKNLKVLMKAMRCVDAILIVVGPAWSTMYLEELKKIGGEKAVFTGEIPLDDLVGAYSACDMLIQPSTNELQSLVILEGMSCGLSIVGANHGPIPELVVEKNNGLLFDPFDEVDLSSKINQLIEGGRIVRKRMSSASLMVAGEHALERSAEKYIELYSSLV